MNTALALTRLITSLGHFAGTAQTLASAPDAEPWDLDATAREINACTGAVDSALGYCREHERTFTDEERALLSDLIEIRARLATALATVQARQVRPS